jgi:glucose-6-phosphate-specific signal transduction histidine kinase
METTKRLGLRILETLMDTTDEEDVLRGLRRELRDQKRGQNIIDAVERVAKDDAENTTKDNPANLARELRELHEGIWNAARMSRSRLAPGFTHAMRDRIDRLCAALGVKPE